MRSMRVRRASMSFSLICTGSSSGGVVVQPASAPAATTNREPMINARIGTSLRLRRLIVGRQIDDFHPAVLGPRGFIVTGRRGTLLAVADRRELPVGGPLQQQRPPDCLRTALTEADVVFP